MVGFGPQQEGRVGCRRRVKVWCVWSAVCSRLVFVLKVLPPLTSRREVQARSILGGWHCPGT